MLVVRKIKSENENVQKERELFAQEIARGLSSSPKSILSKYLYDAQGSKLFEQILELPEYYPSRCESEILERYKERIAGLSGNESFNLVDLGVGDGRKTKILLRHFVKKGYRFNYFPVDLSHQAIEDLRDTLGNELPSLQGQALMGEYFEGLEFLRAYAPYRKSIVLFLGSSIGNFTGKETKEFLYRLRAALRAGDYAIVGFDLQKDPAVIHKAYDDSQGVTREFNLNLLRRINKELGGGFDLSKFFHFPVYNIGLGVMESYLVSRVKQTVFIEATEHLFSFDSWEPIHTEFSFKFLEADIESMAHDAGFQIRERFYDSRHYLVDSVWQAE